MGSGIGVDMGLIWTFADFWFPSIGLALFNLPSGCVDNYLNPHDETRQQVCGMVFSGTKKNTEDPFLVEPTDIRLGFSITPRLTHKLALRIGIDLHHLYLASGSTGYGLKDVAQAKQLHAGVELFYGNPLLQNPISVRFGMGQTANSSGVSLHIWKLYFEYASYGRDVGASETADIDMRKIVTFGLKM